LLNACFNAFFYGDLLTQIKQQFHFVHKIAFLLAFQFAVLSTQPVWQPLKQALFGSCGGSSSSVSAMTCAAAPTLPSGDTDDKTTDDCCFPWCCCFPCCCYCQQLAQMALFAEGEKNTRPAEATKILNSANLGGHFQPPELAQHG